MSDPSRLPPVLRLGQALQDQIEAREATGSTVAERIANGAADPATWSDLASRLETIARQKETNR